MLLKCVYNTSSNIKRLQTIMNLNEISSCPKFLLKSSFSHFFGFTVKELLQKPNWNKARIKSIYLNLAMDNWERHCNCFLWVVWMFCTFVLWELNLIIAQSKLFSFHQTFFKLWSKFYLRSFKLIGDVRKSFKIELYFCWRFL